MAENYEGEVGGYPDETLLETAETRSPNWVLNVNGLGGSPRLVDEAGADLVTDDAAGTITVPTGTSSITSGTTPVTSGVDTRVFFQDGLVMAQDTGLTFSKVTDALTVGGLITVNSANPLLLTQATATSNSQWRVGMLGLNMGFAVGGASFTIPDSTRNGWGLSIELDYLAQDASFVGHGTLQNEFYFTDNGAARPFQGDYATSVAVTVDSASDSAEPGHCLVTLNAASLAAIGISNYLQKGMRFFFTAVGGASGISLNTAYRVFEVRSASTFYLATGATTLTEKTTGTLTSGTMNRGGYGVIGFTVPTSVITGDYRSAAIGGGGTEPAFEVRNTKTTHHAELLIGNAAADSNQAHVDFDSRWRVGNGAVYGNLSTSLDLAQKEYTESRIPLSINHSTTGKAGWIKMGYPTDASDVAPGVVPLAQLDVAGAIYATLTTEQLRLRYDGSNYFSTTVASDGAVTFNAVGAGAAFTFSDAVTLTAGTINNMAIGQATPANGQFTQLTSTSGAFVSSGTTEAGLTAKFYLTADTLTTGTGFYISSVSPSGSGTTTKLVHVKKEGAQTGAVTTTAVKIENVSTGASATNVGLNVTASGGTASNIAIQIGDGTAATEVIASNLSGATDPTITFGNDAVTLSAKLVAPAGAFSTPAVVFTGATTTGFYLVSGSVGCAIAATANVVFASNELRQSAGNFIGWATPNSHSANDTILGREGAAVIQMGADAAGVVTPQTFKACDRITSDGVGADLTIAGGRNRGASVGGSVILQTSPPASAGVTGTLETGLTVSSPTASQKPSVIVGNAAVATTATDGFLYIPASAGTPVGTPTAVTGRIPLCVDSTNHKLYFYSGGAWRDAGP